MKKLRYLSYTGLTLITATLTFSTINFSSANKNQVEAYDRQPVKGITTINLNDCSDSEIKDYYSSLTSKSETEKQGVNLLKNLKSILENGQRYFSYDKDKDGIWNLYEITDRDWEKSPATTSASNYDYNPTTKIITNYQYNSSNNPFVHSLYTNRNIDNQAKAHGDHSQNDWGINQEHVWPKSQGFNAEGDGGARGDPMHLMAGNGSVNNMHSNFMYGYVDLDNSPTSKPQQYLKDNYLGISLTTSETGSNNKVFEPQDSDKGDIARAIFYMVARYNYLAKDGDTINQDNPNLELKQSTLSLSSYTSSQSVTAYMGLMTDLLNWNHIDPPDEFEIHRNNLLYRNYTKNRNPFIDYPEWADYIWGSVTYDGRKYVSYDANPTGYVDLNEDKINGFKDKTGLSISKSKANIEVDSSVKISATSSNGGQISWSTSEPSVASISDTKSASREEITINGLKKGNAVITASVTIDSKQYSKHCEVNVTQSSITSGWQLVTSSNDLVSGDKYVIACNSKEATAGNISSSILTKISSTFSLDLSEISALGSGTVEFTLGGTNNAWTLANSSGKLLRASAVKSLSWEKGTETWSISIDDSNNATIQNNTTNYGRFLYNANSGQERFTTYTSSTSGSMLLPQLYRYVSSGPVLVNGVSLNKSALELQEGTGEKLIVTVSPDNATDKSVSFSSNNPFVASVDENGYVNALAQGNAKVSVTTNDGGYTASCDISVIEDNVVSISVDNESSKLSYKVGEQFNKNDIVLHVNYEHASPKILDSNDKNLTFDITDSYYFDESDIENGKTLNIQYTYKLVTYKKAVLLTVSSVTGALYTFSGSDNVTKKNVPSGSSVSYHSSAGSVILTANNSINVSLGGYQNCRIVGVSLLMKSNQASGSGYISFKAGNEVIANIGDENNPLSFDDDLFYGRFTTSYHYVNLDLTEPYDVKAGTILNLNVNATENSLACRSLNIIYETKQGPTLESISISGTYQTEFNVGDTFNHVGMIVTAHYDDDTYEDVTESSEWSTPDMTTKGTQDVTVSYLTKSIDYRINVIDSPKYVKVTSEPISWEGTYLLVYEDFSYAWTGVDAGQCHTDVTISNNEIATKPDDAVTLTITSTMGGYKVMVNGGTNDGKYINGKSGNNTIAFSETSSVATTISVDENKNVIMSSNNCIMMYNKNSGDTNERFRYYKAGSTQQLIQLYKYTGTIETPLTKAEKFSTKLEHSILCYNGSKTPTISATTWSDLASEFTNLESTAQNYLINATFAVEGDAVTPTGDTTQKIANGVAKYDQLVAKYSFENFMGRDVPNNNFNSLFIKMNDSSLIVTISSVIVSLILIGGYFFYDKRKKNNA